MKRETPNYQALSEISLFDFNWLVGCLCLTSHRQRGHLEKAPHLLSLAKDVKLDKYTVPTTLILVMYLLHDIHNKYFFTIYLK